MRWILSLTIIYLLLAMIDGHASEKLKACDTALNAAHSALTECDKAVNKLQEEVDVKDKQIKEHEEKDGTQKEEIKRLKEGESDKYWYSVFTFSGTSAFWLLIFLL